MLLSFHHGACTGAAPRDFGPLAQMAIHAAAWLAFLLLGAGAVRQLADREAVASLRVGQTVSEKKGANCAPDVNGASCYACVQYGGFGDYIATHCEDGFAVGSCKNSISACCLSTSGIETYTCTNCFKCKQANPCDDCIASPDEYIDTSYGCKSGVLKQTPPEPVAKCFYAY